MNWPEGKYGCILADPPWQFRVWAQSDKAHGAAAAHYTTMPSAEIARFPVGELAARDCALFLWVTYPNLPEGLRVMAAWGFVYKTVAFTWVKLNPKSKTPFLGLGHWTRANAEICLLGTRGHVKRKARDVAQLIVSPRREHSRKPDEQYERIMRLVDGPYIELFARQRWPSWDAWGNEVAG